MASRDAYNQCMSPYMKGGGEDRKLRFCVGAKLCSGKAASAEEAKSLCLSEPPKEKPTGSAGGKRCSKSMAELSACAIHKIDWDSITQATFEEHLTAALQECSCRPAKKIITAPKVLPEVPTAYVPHWSRV